MTYKELYDEVVASGEHCGTMAKIKTLARLIHGHPFYGATTEDDAVWAAIERYEEMTGVYFDPTQDQFDEIKCSIF